MQNILKIFHWSKDKALLIISVTATITSFSLEPCRASERLKTQELTIKRLIPPKQKNYPLLEQLESLLFPKYDFKEDNPGKRLERLELASFGDVQKGSIKSRLDKLKAEIESWQIANASPIKAEEKAKSPQKYHAPTFYRQNFVRPRVHRRVYDNDQNNQLLTPLVQSISRRGINALSRLSR